MSHFKPSRHIDDIVIRRRFDKATHNHTIGTTLATKLYQHTGAYTKHALENVIFKRIFEYHIVNDIQRQLLRREGKLFRDVIASSINPNRFTINVPGDFLSLNDAVEAWNCSNCTKEMEILIQPGRHKLTELLLRGTLNRYWYEIKSERKICCGLTIRGVVAQDGKKPRICGVGTRMEIFINGRSTKDIRFVDLYFNNVQLKVGNAKDVFATRCENIRIEPESKNKITLTDCTYTYQFNHWSDRVRVTIIQLRLRKLVESYELINQLEDENLVHKRQNKLERSHHRSQKQIIRYEKNRQSSNRKRNQMKKQKRNKHRSFGKDRQHFQRRR